MRTPKPTAAQLRQMRKDNLAQTVELSAIPRDEWPPGLAPDARRVRVLRNRKFLVQEFIEREVIRLSVNRTEWDERRGCFRGDIAWEELQKIKAEAGYAERCAIEIYPPEADLVDVANMRHLWITEAPPFMWKGRQCSS